MQINCFRSIVVYFASEFLQSHGKLEISVLCELCRWPFNSLNRTHILFKAGLSKENHLIYWRSRMVVVLKLSGLPYRVSPNEVREFFRGLRLKEEDVHIPPDRGTRFANTAFVLFHNDDDARKATIRSGKMMGTRRIDVALSSMSEMNEAMEGDRDRDRGRGFSGRPSRGRGTFRGRGRGFSRGGGGSFGSREDRSDRDFDSRSRDSGPRMLRGGPPRSRFASRGSSSSYGGSMLRPDSSRDSNRKDFHSPPSRSDTRHNDRRDSRDNRDSRDTRGPSDRRSSSDFSERKFVKLSGVPYNVKQSEIEDFFRGIVTREILFCKHKGGKFAGRPNGEVIIEFFSDKDAREALERDGRRFGTRSAIIMRPRKEDILEVRQEKSPTKKADPIQQLGLSLGEAGSSAQVQNLLQMLSSALAAAGVASAPGKEPQHRGRNDVLEDPVIRRVARNANIDIEDINASKVVGIRNLPFTVTPEEVIDFFRGYGAIPDSVRIHYMEDGRSSGDAIITFRTERDAKRAVEALNNRPVGRRRVELFLL